MNRQNLLGHLALALTIILVAAFAGQVRRWQKERAPEAPVVQEEEVIRVEERDEPAAFEDEDGSAEVIVRFRPGTTVEQMERVASRLNDRVADQYEYVRGYALVEDEDGLAAEEVAGEYMSQPEVEWAEPNMKIELDPQAESAPEYLHALPTDKPNDPMLGEQWGLINTGQRDGKNRADIGALVAWLKKTTGSEQVVVAVLDTGVDYTHSDLLNNVWVRPAALAPYSDRQLGTLDDEHGYNALDNSGDPMDDNGHGTHCAGIIGAEGNNGRGIAGINWKVQVMPLKFMDAGGSGTTKDAVEAINYVIDRKKKGVNVRVISASWGSTQRSRALEEAIRRAGEEGILFVAAAGNSSTNNDRLPHFPSSYPLPNVLSVAALDRRDQLASFSNYGEKSVHIAAPGKEILSTWLDEEYKEASGTSMATPMVAGAAALVLSVEPNMTVEELRERLLKSVVPLDSLKGKVVSGGRLCAASAVGAADAHESVFAPQVLAPRIYVGR